MIAARNENKLKEVKDLYTVEIDYKLFSKIFRKIINDKQSQILKCIKLISYFTV